LGLWYLILGSVNNLVISLSAACGDRSNRISIELVIFVFVLAALSPVAMYVDARADAGRSATLPKTTPF
jgi:hypothetical protein